MEKRESLHGLVSLKRFKEITGMEELQFSKGKGREFCSTPVGVLFMAKDFKLDNPQKFVTIAGEDVKSAKGESLEGTLWLVNSVVTDGALL